MTSRERCRSIERLSFMSSRAEPRHNSTRLRTFLLCLRRNCCNRCSKSAFSVLQPSFSTPSAAQPWQLHCLLPLLSRSILHLLPFYGMKKALFPVLSCCFFNLTSLYNISFFRAKKGNKTAFRAIGGNCGQYRAILQVPYHSPFYPVSSSLPLYVLQLLNFPVPILYSVPDFR